MHQDLVERLRFHGRYASEDHDGRANRTNADKEAAAMEIERLRLELAEQDHFILHFTDAKRNGDWACAECKPGSDMIIAGFKCGWHRAVSRNPVT